MGVVKLNLSLDEEVAATMRHRAAEQGVPVSQYLARLIREEERRREDALAEEGYRLLSEESLEFATGALPLAHETWS